MTKKFKEITGDVSKKLQGLRKSIPDVMDAFGALSQAATKDGALDKKTKELIALGTAVAARCDACIGFHSKSLCQLGASEAEVMETLGMAVYMGGGPSLMYAAEAVAAFKEFAE